MNSLYNVGETAIVARPPADAYLVLNSADRSTSTSSTAGFGIPLTQPYNNFRLQKPENMVQGGFTRLALTEINFPYSIPNVNARNNSFWVVLRQTTQDVKAEITIPILPTSMSGSEIASYVQGVLNFSDVSGATWSVDYYPESVVGYQASGFAITTVADASNVDFALYPVEPILNYPAKPTLSASANTKSLLDVMGFNSLSNWAYLTALDKTVPNELLSKASTYAPLTYTKFIDIVSQKLTYHQNVRDGSTSALSGTNIIYRLYISDNTSTTVINQYYDGAQAVKYLATPPPGSVPTVIHRQIVSPKVFNWQANTAIDWIDIQLLDDMGQPLYVPEEGLPDFQITFKVSED